MSLESVFKVIHGNPDDVFLFGPVADELIAAAEHALGLQFPGSYKSFLRHFGCGDIFGIEFYGIADEDDAEGLPNVVWVTGEMRRANLPMNFVPVADGGDGFIYVLNTAEMQDGECPVLLWDEVRFEIVEAFTDFGAFLYEMIRT
jgi:hypothetical protein